MGLLGDLYSTIDSKKRQLRGLLSDPVETLYQGVRNFGAEQQGLLDMQARAYPWTGTDRTAAPDLAARKALADAGAAQGMAAATVWHGSPHKFDKFDSSKIGTGEGAQAYGHGLYLAENPSVATEYSKMGSAAGGPIPSPLRFINGQEVQPGTGAYKAASLLDSMSVSQAKKTVNGWLQSARPGEAAYFKEVSDTLAGIGSKAAVKQKPPGGSLYKVDLPDEHIAKMLDWDKPLLEQQSLLKSVPEFAEANQAVFGHPISTSEPLADMAYQTLSKHLGGADKAADLLRKRGIPGIRYLDGGSRGAGTGSSNFVVFPGNEGLLSILERNGAPIK